MMFMISTTVECPGFHQKEDIIHLNAVLKKTSAAVICSSFASAERLPEEFISLGRVGKPIFPQLPVKCHMSIPADSSSGSARLSVL